MKHLHDEGAQPDQNLQSQLALAAREQLGLDSQITLPQLPTPAQKSAGLRAAPPTPGLGHTPSPTHSPQPGASPSTTPAAPALPATPTPPAALNPAVAPAATSSTPLALATPSTSTLHQPTGRLEPTQSQSIKTCLQPHHDYVQHHHHHHHQQQQQQQHHGRQAAESQTSNSSWVKGDGLTKQWQGKLYVVNAKGEEFVCELMTDAWPAHLSR